MRFCPSILNLNELSKLEFVLFRCFEPLFLVSFCDKTETAVYMTGNGEISADEGAC